MATKYVDKNGVTKWKIERKPKQKTAFGKILWVSEKDCNGIIKCNRGNEYYFDKSIMESREWEGLLDIKKELMDIKSNIYLWVKYKRSENINMVREICLMQGRFVDLTKDVE